VAKDDQQAVVWFRKAAEQGLAAAQQLRRRLGVAQDTEQSGGWYRKALSRAIPMPSIFSASATPRAQASPKIIARRTYGFRLLLQTDFPPPVTIEIWRLNN
jgi:hypothetical protein